MTATYAQAKGRELQPETAKLPPLSDDQRAVVAGRYGLIKEHMPEIVPLIRELHDVGLIDGLRAIASVELINGEEP